MNEIEITRTIKTCDFSTLQYCSPLDIAAPVTLVLLVITIIILLIRKK